MTQIRKRYVRTALRKTATTLAAALCTVAGAQHCRTHDIPELSHCESSGKIITTSYSIGIGTTEILDTYLSQEHFSGTGITFLATSDRIRPGRKWSTTVQHQANLSATHDRADNFDELEGSYNFFWGRMRNWYLCDSHLRLQAGATGNTGIGFIYNISGGNNPAQARFHIDVRPAASAAYRFDIGRCRITAGYSFDMALAGLMFSPNYGQSYYEIFSRGDYDRNIVPTTAVSMPYFRQQLTVDINVGRKLSLRAGYLGDYQQSHVNSLKQHIYSHRFMIGFIKRFRITGYRP
ncbi:DUF3316 domain-containing protein [Xylanibacter muris]|uniref:DUF3316 domain-containing protein n=1 Tax=Xylanibacter muris TaxID=2736290 RepID=A0ABX2ANX7_9BACT|nr:DUF3316 domain-containing protein [Xylanibacter muris]NPD92913.1 DUF3316 domain-containing protein [Xylanibacter muris]